MDTSDVKKIVDELKDLHLISCNRDVVPLNKGCIFHAKNISSSIEYSSNLLNYLSKDVFLWIVLHEEYHLTHKLRAKRNGDIDLVISVILAFIITTLIEFPFFSIFTRFIPLFSVLTVICFIIIFISTTYIHKKYFSQSYHQDEFDADEYAVKGLFLSRPNLIAWQIMYSSFQSFTDCSERDMRERPTNWFKKFFLKLHLLLFYSPHPKNEERIQKVRTLFNKYNSKRREVSSNTTQ
jgi:Zn-dependent protease with chaperone function